MDVYVTEFHPIYQVWVDGKVYKTLVANKAKDKTQNYPLTWNQQHEIAQNFRKYLETKEEINGEQGIS